LADAEQVLSGGMNNQREVHLTSTFGKNVWVNARMARLTSAGEPHLLLVLNDITDRRTAEDALKFEREQLLSLFESINEVILVIDPRTYEILYANKFTEGLYGRTLVGGICHERLNGFDAPCTHCHNEKILKLQGQPYQWEYSSAILKRDFLATDRMIRWPDGRDVKFQIAVDITERKEAEQEQEHLKAQLFHAQKMESVGTLAGGIAHDFNNLLTVILGFSELLLTGKDERDASYEDLQKIHQAARNGADLVKRILAFSRKTEINPRPLDLNHEIEQAKELLRRTLQKMIEVELVLSEGIPPINADPVQIEQVLMNLAVNASHAMPDGGKLTIETKQVTLDEEYCRLHVEAKPGDYVMLSVSDTGHGMDQETLQHIFEPFYTTKETGEGTGLGLSMVYGIVRQHGGHITCHSKPGEGATFKIYLSKIPTEATSETSAEKPLLSHGTETILLVDDEEMVRDLGKRILERSGYTVLTVANGKQAVNLYRKQRETISLVILDLVMPQMGGKQCLEQLLEINAQVKVLVTSGYAAAGRTTEAIESGARGFVAKPYNVKAMLEAVREVLDAE
jgi:signal transduction histidine kinase/ActR/RegA family two-component response regulator